MEKIIRMTIMLMLICSMSIIPNAQMTKAESVVDDDTVKIGNITDNLGDPVEVRTYKESDGTIVTEKIFFIPDNDSDGTSLRDASGRGWYINEKEYKWASGNSSTYYAQGYFVWGDGDVSVSSPTGGIYNVPSTVTISNKSTTSGTGKYGYVFNKFAYVKFTCTVNLAFGTTKDLSVTIRVSESGNLI